MVQKQYVFSRNCNSDFEYCSFPGVVMCGKSFMVLGKGCEPELPVRLAIMRVNN